MAAALSLHSQNQRHLDAQMKLVDKGNTVALLANQTAPEPLLFPHPNIKALMWGVKPDSLYLSGTKPNPSSLETISALDPSNSSTMTNAACWIVAITADGGPFLHYYTDAFPDIASEIQVIGTAQQASLRNYHESNYNGVLCFHFQNTDSYDANWTHICGNATDGTPMEWQEAKYAPAGGPPRSKVQTFDKVVIKPGVSDPTNEGPGTWNVILYQGACEGHGLIIEFQWYNDFRGIQALSTSPKLSDACFHQVEKVVIDNHLEEWMPIRANMDGNRPLEDWPW